MNTDVANGNLRVLMTADTIGGVWTYCMELARALEPQGIEILLATMGAPASKQQRFEAKSLANVTLYESHYALEWMDDPWLDVNAAGGWLLDLGERLIPDVIHLNGYAHAALPWKAPVLCVAHSCVLSWWRAVKGEDAPSQFFQYHRRVENGLRASDMIVAPSSEMLRALGDHYEFGTPSRVIANGRDCRRFRPDKKEAVIFSAGRLWDEAKNTALLARIAPQLDWEVRIAGAMEDPGASCLNQPLNAAGLNPCQECERSARMLGHLEPDDLTRQLAKASIYAAPARYEPFGLGILEAALSGCALVLSDLPSLRENWESTALFVLPGDDQAWIAALNQLAADPGERARLAKLAGERARCFTPNAMAGRYLELYRDLVPERFVKRVEVAA